MGLPRFVAFLIEAALAVTGWVSVIELEPPFSPRPVVLAFDLSECVAQVVTSTGNKDLQGARRAALLLFARRHITDGSTYDDVRWRPTEEECRVAAATLAAAVLRPLTAACVMGARLIPVLVIESRIDPYGEHPKAALARKRAQQRKAKDKKCLAAWLHHRAAPAGASLTDERALELLGGTSGSRTDKFLLEAVRKRAASFMLPVLEPVDGVELEFDAIVHRLLLDREIDAVFSRDGDIVARVMFDPELRKREMQPFFVHTLRPRATPEPQILAVKLPSPLSPETCDAGRDVLYRYLITDYSPSSCGVGVPTFVGYLCGDAKSTKRVKEAEKKVGKEVLDAKRGQNSVGFSPCGALEIQSTDSGFWDAIKRARARARRERR